MGDAEPLPPPDLLGHRDFLHRIARAMLRDPDSADDAVQETMAAALTSRASGQLPHEPARRRWLAAVLRNVVRKRWRSRTRRSRWEQGARPPTPTPGPDVLAARAEVIRTIGTAVSELPALQREVVLLRYYEAQPPRTIAKGLGVSINTVKSRLRLALARLRTTLDAQDLAPGDADSGSPGPDWRAILPGAVGLDGVLAKSGVAAAPAASVATTGAFVMKKIAAAAALLLLCVGGVIYVLEQPAGDSGGDMPSADKAGGQDAAPALEPRNAHMATGASAPDEPGSEERNVPTDEGATPPTRGWPTREELGKQDLLQGEIASDSIVGNAISGTSRVDERGVSVAWRARDVSELFEKMGAHPEATLPLPPGGGFRFDNMAAGSWFVGIRLEDGILRASHRRHVLPRKEAEPPALLLLGTASVHGTVYDAEGRPKSGALVQVTFNPPKGSPLDSMVMEMRTDENGRYDLVRLPGGYGGIIAALADPHWKLGNHTYRPLYLAPGTRKRIDWGTPTPMGTIRGVVLCGGEPVAQSDGATQGFVQFQPKDRRKPGLVTTYDERGHYTQQLPPGTYGIRVTHRGLTSNHASSAPTTARVQIEAGATQDVDLEIKGARIGGQILYKGKKADSAWVRVTWTANDQPRTNTQIVVRGSFAFCSLPAGRYELAAAVKQMPRSERREGETTVMRWGTPVTVVVGDGDSRTIELVAPGAQSR